MADESVGASKRRVVRYALVYRSIDHRVLKELCGEARKTTPAAKYAPYVPSSGWGANIQAFANALIDLQEKRHAADYDPFQRFKTSDAKLAIQTARSAIRRFNKANELRRRTFPSLLAFPPR